MTIHIESSDMNSHFYLLNWEFSRNVNEFKKVLFFIHILYWLRSLTTKVFYNLNNIYHYKAYNVVAAVTSLRPFQ